MSYPVAPTLEVHNNSYVTLEEADALINEMFISTQAEFQAWFNPDLPEGDKVRALTSSCIALNNLKYHGSKLRRFQKLAFPRKIVNVAGFAPILFVSQSYDNTLIDGLSGGGNGFELAKRAQVANAVAMLSLDNNIVRDVTERLATGIKARKLQSVSEEYSDTEKRTTALMKGIYARDKVQFYLNSWLGESVRSL